MIDNVMDHIRDEPQSLPWFTETLKVHIVIT